MGTSFLVEMNNNEKILSVSFRDRESQRGVLLITSIDARQELTDTNVSTVE